MVPGFAKLMVGQIRAKGSPVVAKAYATIPSVNMWDDHVSAAPYIY